MIAVAEEGDAAEEATVDEVDETREELDEVDETSEVVEEVKVDEAIVEFWQATIAAKPITPDKIEVFMTKVTTFQRGVRMSECSVGVENCLKGKFSIDEQRSGYYIYSRDNMEKPISWLSAWPSNRYSVDLKSRLA